MADLFELTSTYVVVADNTATTHTGGQSFASPGRQRPGTRPRRPRLARVLLSARRVLA